MPSTPPRKYPEPRYSYGLTQVGDSRGQILHHPHQRSGRIDQATVGNECWRDGNLSLKPDCSGGVFLLTITLPMGFIVNLLRYRQKKWNTTPAFSAGLERSGKSVRRHVLVTGDNTRIFCDGGEGPKAAYSVISSMKGSGSTICRF